MPVVKHRRHPGYRVRRYGEILSILLRHGFGDIFQADKRIKRFLRRIAGRQAGNPLLLEKWEWVKLTLEDLGPTFIKFGQILSNRPDILPKDLIEQLCKLQESVLPFDGEKAREIIEDQLQKPIEALFDQFEITPYASASIAQVHRARLKSGEQVVVKVVRPGIRRIIETDISIMYQLARVAERQFPKVRHFTPTDIVREFHRAIQKEINLLIELSHIHRFGENFKGDKRIYVPKTYSSYCTSQVLVMEYIDGYSPSRTDELDKLGIDRKNLAVKAVMLVLEQLFKHGFFHADPHPGNIRILRDDTICFLDYGMMGNLIPEWQKQLTNLMLGLAKRDSANLADTIMILSRSTEVDIKAPLEYDINDLLDKYSYVSLKYLRLGEMLQEVFQVIFQYKLQFPPAFFLLAKAIATIESIAVMLDPEFNVVDNIKPFAKKMVQEKANPKTLGRDIAFMAAEYGMLIKELPGELRDILQQVRSGNTHLQFHHHGLDPFTRSLERAGNRLSYAIVLAAIIIGSSLITVSHIPPLWKNISLIGISGFVVSGIVGFVLLFGIWRRHR